MIRPVTLVWVGLAAIVAVSLFFVKYKVQGLDEQMATLDAEKRATQEAIHVLDAEWTYLNRPERLEALAEKHLSLSPASPAQLAVYGPNHPAPANTKTSISLEGGGE